MIESSIMIGENIGMQSSTDSLTDIRLYINIENKIKSLGDLFGLFFEDLNHAADGGLYAEMIRNRNFEFSEEDNKEYTALTGWSTVCEDNAIGLSVLEGNRDDGKVYHYLHMKVNSPECGIQNNGYNSGLFLQEGQFYILTCYAKGSGEDNQKLTVTLCDQEERFISEVNIRLTDDWNKHEVVLTAPCTDYAGKIKFTLPKPGEVYLDYVSLFPEETFRNRRNGLRKDLAQALADMKPKFMRFPGGCLIHCGSLCADDRNSMYRWKKTLGDVERREPKSSSWGYHQTLGLGYYEYFLFCEDIGAKPIPVIAAGFNPHTQIGAPISEMQEWVDEALDLIEFANGDVNTKWGRIRSEMGHPESFNLEYLAIGNEEQGKGFFERYEIIHHAVRAKYPDIKLINSAGPFCAGGDFEAGWKSAIELKSDIVDEHYYQAPEWFVANHHRYDTYHSNAPKVFLGEYASQGNNWYNALVEASYMIGLEKNCDKVALACYAPMLANVDYVNWKDANMIWFNNNQLLLTPNYYVQKLFMNHQGDSLLETRLETDIQVEEWIIEEETIQGDVILSSNGAVVEYSNIEITSASEINLLSMKRCLINNHSSKVKVAQINEEAYTITFQVKQISQEGQGFSVQFGKKENGDYFGISLGGWNKANNTVNQYIKGKQICICQYPFELEVDRDYDVKIMVNGRRIQVMIDGIIYQDIERSHILVEPLYCSSSIENESGDIVVKVVNLKKYEKNFEVILSNHKTWNYTAFIMSGYELDDSNELGISKIKPIKEEGIAYNGKMQYKVPAEAFIVFRLTKA